VPFQADPMNDTCDLCHAPELIPVYQPAGSTRGLRVYLCLYCGLVQSLPRADRAPRQSAAVSNDADWGNVRYGKGFRTDACLALLRAQTDFAAPLTILDVGSNRGSFARALVAVAPRAELTCVEPDERVAESCAGLARARLIRARIEDAKLPHAAFDVVHSCHTLEHLASPSATLAYHWRVLKPGGLLILDAPDIGLIGGEDIVEEWFIDKHLYHFSRVTLRRVLAASGFEIVAEPDSADPVNLLFAARKSAEHAEPLARNEQEVDAALALLTSYVGTRARNLAALTHVAAEIAGLAPKRVALWGAGRLFDALVRHGGFNPATLSTLIDTHLRSHVPERHGIALSGPEALTASVPDVVVVMSRSFSREIAREIRQAAPTAEILLYTDLLARARARAAA
jgi:SAM-dependent methyltransferase